MNFEKYKNTLPYPEAKDFTVKYWYKQGQRIAKQVAGGDVQYEPGFSSEHLATAVLERATRDTDYKAAKTAYNAETSRLMQQFKADLFEDLGITDNPKANTLYSRAWDYGHSSGLREVHNYASDLVDLIV